MVGCIKTDSKFRLKYDFFSITVSDRDSINRPGSPAINDTNNPLYIRR